MRRRRRPTCLLATALLLVLPWSALAWLSSRPEEAAIRWADRLFGWAVLATFLAAALGYVASSSRPRLAAFRCTMVTVAAAAALAALEAAAALRLVDWGLVAGRLAGVASEYGRSYRPDPDLVFARLPGRRWSERPPSDIEAEWSMPASLAAPITFTYDRHGYRNPETLARADVALIGDSFVEGWYVSDEQTVARRLQARSGRPVVNLGVAGYGALQELIVLRRDAVRFRPAVVIWFFFEGNDLSDDQRFENARMAPAPGASDGSWAVAGPPAVGWMERSFTLNLVRLLRRCSHPVLANRVPYRARMRTGPHAGSEVLFAGYAGVPWSDWTASRWQETEAAFGRAVRLAEAGGFRLVLCFVPLKFRVYRPFLELPPHSPLRSWELWPLRELFTAFCSRRGVPCLDLTDALQDAVRRGGMPYAAADTHWSPEGHDLVAEKLAGEIARRGWAVRSH